jgi:hypothetical protein
MQVSDLWKTYSFIRTEVERSSSSSGSSGSGSSGGRSDGSSSDGDERGGGVHVQRAAGGSASAKAARGSGVRKAKKKHTTLRGCRYVYALESLLMGASAADTAQAIGHTSINSQKVRCTCRLTPCVTSP